MTAHIVQDDDGPQHFKQVSRVKHIILQKYLPSWEVILGSKNRRLCYFDCYAGPGDSRLWRHIVVGRIAVDPSLKKLPARCCELESCSEEPDRSQYDFIEGFARKMRDALLPKLIRGEIRVKDAERLSKKEL